MPNKNGEYSIPELAEALDVATSTVWKWCDGKRRKELQAKKFKRGRTRGWLIPGAVAANLIWRAKKGLPYFED